MRTGGGKLLNKLSQEINPATEDKQDILIDLMDGKYDILIDDVSTADMIYVGKAPAGSSTADAIWQIFALNETGTYLQVKYADGVSNFTKIWDNRTTYVY